MAHKEKRGGNKTATEDSFGCKRKMINDKSIHMEHAKLRLDFKTNKNRKKAFFKKKKRKRKKKNKERKKLSRSKTTESTNCYKLI